MKNILVFLTAIVFLLLSCAKDEVDEVISIDQKEISMYSKDTKQLNLAYSTDALKTKSYTWTSRNENVATVSGSGLVTGVRIGETYVLASSTDGSLKDSAKVTITPKYNLYKEPYLGFGATMAVVKANETRSLLIETTGLAFNGENSSVRMVMYTFTNNAMTSAGVLLANNTSTSEQVTYFLFERYQYLTNSNDVYYFSNNKGVIAALSVDASLGLNVIYMKDPNLKSVYSFTELYKKCLNEVKKEYSSNKSSL